MGSIWIPPSSKVQQEMSIRCYDLPIPVLARSSDLFNHRSSTALPPLNGRFARGPMVPKLPPWLCHRRGSGLIGLLVMVQAVDRVIEAHLRVVGMVVWGQRV